MQSIPSFPRKVLLPILWKDSKRADEAARVMKMTAKELKELGIIERVIPEPEPADPETLPEIAKTMEDAMEEFFETWTPLGGKTLAERRYERFRSSRRQNGENKHPETIKIGNLVAKRPVIQGRNGSRHQSFFARRSRCKSGRHRDHFHSADRI